MKALFRALFVLANAALVLGVAAFCRWVDPSFDVAMFFFVLIVIDSYRDAKRIEKEGENG